MYSKLLEQIEQRIKLGQKKFVLVVGKDESRTIPLDKFEVINWIWEFSGVQLYMEKKTVLSLLPEGCM